MLWIVLAFCIFQILLYFSTQKEQLFDYHVIHLSHRTDRMNHIHEMEKRIGHPLKIFKASGPRVLEGFKPGEVGCYDSHMRIMDTPRKTKYSVIFEDDFIVQDNFHSRVNTILQDIGEFDILYLGNLEENHGKHVKGDVFTVNVHQTLFGTHGYIVNNKNTRKITSKLQYKDAIDNELGNLIKSGDVNGFVVWPSIVHQNNNLVSSIRVPVP